MANKPELKEKIKDILERYGAFIEGNDMTDDCLNIDEALSLILPLFLNIEEAKKQERERIAGWLTRKVYSDCLLIPHDIIEAIRKGKPQRRNKMTPSETLIAGLKQRSCEVGQYAPKFITTCDYCGAEVWYEKGKKFFECPNPLCGKTNYREQG